MAGFTDKFSVRVKKEIAKIKAMPTWKLRLEHIWGYYKIHILMTIFVIVCTISIIRSINSNNFDHALNFAIVNTTTMDMANSTHILEARSNEWLGLDGVNAKTTFEGYLVVDPDKYSEELYASQMKIGAAVAAAQYDMFIADDVFMNAYRSAGFCRDLSVFLPEDLYNELLSEGRIIIYESEEFGPVPSGIDMSGLGLTDELVFTIEKPILSVVTNAPNPENCIEFIRHLLSYEPN